MRTLIRLAIAALALGVVAGSAAAQVAAPNLSPVPFPNLNRPSNPAVVPWREASFVGVTLGKDKFENGGQTFAKGNTNQIDLSIVGDSFGLAISRFELSADIDAAFGGGTTVVEQTDVALGMRLGEILAIGLAQEQTKDKSTPTAGVADSLPLLGVSVRLAEVFYLGAAMGNKSVNDPGNPKFEQAVQRYGVAAVLGQKESRAHVEWYHETVDAYADPAIGYAMDGTEIDGLTLEGSMNGIYLGYDSRKRKFVDNAGLVVNEERWKTVSVGWQPPMGLSVTAFSAAITEPLNPAFKVSIQGVNVGWAF